MRKLRKLFQLSASDRYLLLETAVLLSAIRLSLWLLPFKVWRSVLEESSSFLSKLPKMPLGKISWAVNVVSSQMPGRIKCLAKALTTHILMSKYGYAPRFKIGVAKGKEGQLEAHAWVENSEGKIIIGWLQDLERYLPLPSLQVANKF